MVNERGGASVMRCATKGERAETYLSWAVTLLVLPPMMCTLLRIQPLSGRSIEHLVMPPQTEEV